MAKPSRKKIQKALSEHGHAYTYTRSNGATRIVAAGPPPTPSYRDRDLERLDKEAAAKTSKNNGTKRKNVRVRNPWTQ